MCIVAMASLSACRPTDAPNEGLLNGGSASAAGAAGAGGGSSFFGVPPALLVPFSGLGNGRSEGISIPDASNITVASRSAPGGALATVNVSPTNMSYSDANVFIPDVVDATLTGVRTPRYESGNTVIGFEEGSEGTHAHSVYGYVTNQVGGAINSAGYHAGDIQSTPNTIQAEYGGVFIGQHFQVGTANPPDYIGELMTLSADFGSGKVSATIPVVTQNGGRGGFTTDTGIDLEVDADILGTTFDGTVRFVDSGTSNPVGTISSSSASGAFYGPEGLEAAGALRVEGEHAGVQRAIVGGFGARLSPASAFGP